MNTKTLSRAQVRDQFAEVTNRVVRDREEVHFGMRGEDEITMIATPVLRELKRLAQKGAAAEAEAARSGATPDPWAGLKQMVRERAGVEPAPPLGRRLPAGFDPDAVEVGAPAWDEMARRGAQAWAEMEFVRRRTPR